MLVNVGRKVPHGQKALRRFQRQGRSRAEAAGTPPVAAANRRPPQSAAKRGRMSRLPTTSPRPTKRAARPCSTRNTSRARTTINPAGLAIGTSTAGAGEGRRRQGIGSISAIPADHLAGFRRGCRPSGRYWPDRRRQLPENADVIQIAQDLSKMAIDTSFAEADIGNIKEGLQVKFSAAPRLSQPHLHRQGAADSPESDQSAKRRHLQRAYPRR